MGCKCILKQGFNALLLFGGFVAFVLLVPNLPPFTKFSSYEIDPVKPEFENLDHCTSLNGAGKVLEGKIHGPEVFKIINGELYTGLASGEVVKVTASGKVQLVTKIGGPCAGYWEEEKCGRPLSLDYCEKTRKLYVLDSYHGIWRMDLDSKNKELLVSPSVKIVGTVPKLFNSMVLAKNGDLFWTHSSNDFSLQDGFYTTLADPSGRLMHYSASKNRSVQLLEGLGFANGVALSPDEKFIIVAETTSMRIMKHHISGAKAGETEVFVTGLPGYPDNIQVLPDGSGVLVGQYVAFDSAHPCLSRHFTKIPLLRKFLARSLRMLELPFEYANQHFPNVVLEQIVYYIGHFKMASRLLSPLNGFLRIDWNGNIVNCYINSDNTLGTVSDVIEYNQKLYLGSPHNDYIGTVPIPKDLVDAFKSNKFAKSEQVPKPKLEKPVQQKPVETKPPTPKPVETKPPTPKPVQTKPPTPKPVETKPPTPKPVETKPPPPKPVETKPPTPKPVETKPPTPKPVETKPPPPKPVENKPSTPKPQAPKPVETKPSPKPIETKPSPKPVETKPVQTKPPPPKPTEIPDEPEIVVIRNPPPKQQIPIEEEIPSDTAKPNKGNLKVIKKSGPTEIPNPQV